VLARLGRYQPRQVDIDGCVYREGLQAVRVSGGVAGNVVPDVCDVTVNFRFAPDRTVEAATEHVREVFDGLELIVTDSAPGALPGLDAPAARGFLASTGAAPVAKYGWTDVSRFAALGIPAINFGPGENKEAHQKNESTSLALLHEGYDIFERWLLGVG
jgi:succinyl-diaminopimelate desuccinylase